MTTVKSPWTQGATILEAAKRAGIHIPTLCDYKDPHPSQRLPGLSRRGGGSEGPCGRLLLPGVGRHEGQDRHSEGKGCPPPCRRSAPLGPSTRLHDLRQIGRVRAAGDSPINWASSPPASRGDTPLSHRSNQSFHNAGLHQVRPLRPLRSRLRRSAGHRGHRLQGPGFKTKVAAPSTGA